MTPYAESLIEYCMWFGKRSREDAIKLLDYNVTPSRRLSHEQPLIDEVKTIQDSEDE